MAKLLDPKVLNRMEAAEGVVYLLRTPSVADVARYEREVRAAGGRKHSVGELWRAVETGLEALAEHGDVEDSLGYVRSARARLVELVTEMNAAEGEAREAAAKELGALLFDEEMDRIAEAVAAADPRLRRMVADNEVYQQVRGQVAARLFLAGWEGVEGSVRRGLDGASEATLRLIPQARFPDIAAFVDGLLRPAEGERKNS